MTKAIILCAGKGSRLGSKTKNIPKTILRVGGIPLLTQQINALKENGINDINIISGHKADELDFYKEKIFYNKYYKNSNMVKSLMNLDYLFDGSEDILITYGDIVYEKNIINKLLKDSNEFVIVSDLFWRNLWKIRMSNYINDIESFTLNENGQIINIGEKVYDEKKVKGQYIGIIKISKNIHFNFLSLYRKGKREIKDFNNISFTSFIQFMINNGLIVYPSFIKGGWLELDTKEDIYKYNNLYANKSLDKFYKLGIYSENYNYLRKKYNNSFINNFNSILKIKNLPYIFLYSNSIKYILSIALPIARKIEIKKILYKEYNIDTFLPNLKTGIIDPEIFTDILISFLYLYEITSDIRHLNTVLKAQDLGGELSYKKTLLTKHLEKTIVQVI